MFRLFVAQLARKYTILSTYVYYDYVIERKSIEPHFIKTLLKRMLGLLPCVGIIVDDLDELGPQIREVTEDLRSLTMTFDSGHICKVLLSGQRVSSISDEMIRDPVFDLTEHPNLQKRSHETTLEDKDHRSMRCADEMNDESKQSIVGQSDSGYASASRKECESLELGASIEDDTGSIYSQQTDLETSRSEKYIEELARLLSDSVLTISGQVLPDVYSKLPSLLKTFATRLAYDRSDKTARSMVFIHRHRQ